MKRFFSLTVLTAVLVACGGASTTFDVEYLRVTEDQKKELPMMIERMVEGRVASAEKKVVKQSFTPTAAGGTLAVTVSDQEGVDRLKEQLGLPFSFRIMKQAPEGQKGDIQTDKFGNFSETGLTEEHVDWVDARIAPAGGATSLDVIFTPEGRTLLTKVFAENKGKLVGVFVRGRLMSLKEVAENESAESVVIDNVPSASIAANFSDDVNVSIHTKITPR